MKGLFIEFVAFFCLATSLTVIISSDDADIVEESKCDEKLFLKPYLILRDERDGPDKSKLEKPGLMDLSNVKKSFVCINGAVIIYKNSQSYTSKHDDEGKKEGLEFEHVAKVDSGKSLKFSDGSFKILSHSCLPVNWQSKDNDPSQMAGVFLLSSTSTNASDSSENNSSSSNSSEHKTEPPSVKVILNQRDFGYKLGKGEGVIMDVSFVLSGSGPFCLELPEDQKIHITSSHANNSAVCRWSPSHEEGEKTDYKRFFRKGLHVSEYKWVDCSDMKNGTEANQTSCDESGNNGNSSEPCEDDVTRHKPFATYKNPMRTGTATSAKKLHPDKESKSHNGSTKESSEEVFQDDKTSEPRTYRIHLNECVEVPQFNKNDPSCSFLNSNDSSSCPKLSAAMELPEEQSNNETQRRKRENEGSEKEVSRIPGTLESIPSLEWKHNILLLIGSIFSKICVPIKSQSIFQLIRIISNYLLNAHGSDPDSGEYANLVEKPNMWDIIIARLNRCNHMKDTKPMEWEFSGLPSTIKPLSSNNDEKRNKRDTEEEEEEEEEEEKEEEPTDNVKEEAEMGEDAPSSALENSYDFVAKVITSYKDEGIGGEVSQDQNQDDFHKEESTDDFDLTDKLMIQRSPSLFNFDDDDESTNEFVQGNIPRWKRTSETETPKIPLPFIQEFIPPSGNHEPASQKEGKGGQYAMRHEDFMIFPEAESLKVKGFPDKQIFYYKDFAEIQFQLNPVIDAFWKIASSTIAFCQKYEKSRESAIYPLAYDNFDQYFLLPLKDEWKKSLVPQDANLVLGEFGDEDREMWLNTCLETAYILGGVLHFRPSRPILFDESHEKFEGDGKTMKVRSNEFIDVPENHEGKYFTKEIRMPKASVAKGNKDKDKKRNNGTKLKITN